MEAKDWLPILFERSNATTALWNVEIVVVLGIVAFVGGAGARLNYPPIKMAIIFGFIVMAVFNLFALIQVTEQRSILYGFLGQINGPSVMTELRNSPAIIPPLRVPPVAVVATSHIIVDLTICLFVWFYPAWAMHRKAL
jgi:hypothetical protein